MKPLGLNPSISSGFGKSDAVGANAASQGIAFGASGGANPEGNPNPSAANQQKSDE